MSDDLFSLEGRSAVVTGGASGIGLGIARRLGAAGANVLIADLNEAAGRAAVETFDRPEGVRAMAIDIALDGSPDQIVQRCRDEFGAIDIIVSNAAIFPPGPILDLSPEDADAIYRVNLRGLTFCSLAAARAMIEQQTGGRIVNISSIAADRPVLLQGFYGALKAGVSSLTRSLALELAPHRINANAIQPGSINPGRPSRLPPDQEAAMVQRIPLGRKGVPDDIARAALFLASAASDYITGQQLVVDGGLQLT